jgi:hypothetical protein
MEHSIFTPRFEIGVRADGSVGVYDTLVDEHGDLVHIGNYPVALEANSVEQLKEMLNTISRQIKINPVRDVEDAEYSEFSDIQELDFS